jgi:S2P endopeptidase
MSHIGYYLLALTICGLFHEAGHAIASYSQGVPIQSSGMFVLYLYPGAFVNIPDQQLQSLNAFKQLRIMCAGVWHNLVLYVFTYVSLGGGLKMFLLLLGWQSLEGLNGVSVVHVRENSPLAPHLLPSTIIYQMDDFPLARNIEDWNTHLFQEDGRHVAKQGFCIAKPVEDYGGECCDINNEYPFGKSMNASISCFNAFPSNQNVS